MNTAIRTLRTMIIALAMIGIIGTAIAGAATADGYDSSVVLENKNTSTWQPITGAGGFSATVSYNATGDTFDWKITGHATPNTYYSLIYYADKPDRFVNWGGNNPGILIGTMYAQTEGVLHGNAAPNTCPDSYGCSGSIDLGMSLPCEPDWNINPEPNYTENDGYVHPNGAKLWLVPSDDYNEVTHEVTSWKNASDFLFETDLITYTDTNASVGISIGDVTSCEYDFRNVTVPVMVSNAYNVGSMNVTVSYNESLVKVVNVTNGVMDVMNYLIGDGQVVINTYQDNSTGMTGIFNLVDITFEPVDNGECDLTITPHCYDATIDTIEVDSVTYNGEYNTTEFTLGDVNDNGAVDVGDVMVLAKHVLEMDGFDDIDECAADVDRNYAIGVHDVEYLARAVLGDPAYTLDPAKHI